LSIFLLLRLCLLMILIAVFGLPFAFAEDFFISKTNDADNIIFDGKWTFVYEWKRSSFYQVNDNDGQIMVRLSHDFKNIYVLLDVLSDKTKSHLGDYAIICFDTKNNGGQYIQDDDFCFQAVMDSKNSKMFQGGGDFGSNNHLRKIESPSELITIGGFSDHNDRYSITPHATYEYKIPIEILGYSDVYGFYVQVFDDNTGNRFTYPPSTTDQTFPFIASPEKWGKIISPDKSIPEFEYPTILMIAIIFPIILLSKKLKSLHVSI